MLRPGEDAGSFRLGVITSTFPFGANEMFLRPELDALTRLGCRITIFPAAARTNRTTYPSLDHELVRFPLLAPRTLLHAARGFCRNARGAMSALLALLRAKSGLGTRLKNLTLFATGLAVADAVGRRGITHIHAYWLSGASTVAFVASKVLGVGWSYSAHSWDIFMADNLISEKTQSAEFGRVVSELGRRGIEQRSQHVADRVLEVIHLGVMPCDNRHAPADRGSTLRPIRILCPTAALIPVKGHRYLLEALRIVVDAGVDCHCILAGEGPLRVALAQQIRDLRLETTVEMPGRFPHDELLKQMSAGAFDVVVLPSIEIGPEFEGIPVSLMEAMAANIPCIATATGAIAELLDGGCGVLVEQKDARAIAEAIMAIASGPERRKEIRERAARRVAAQFDARTSARELARLMMQSSDSSDSGRRSMRGLN